MRTRTWLPFVVVLAAVGAACSGGDEASDATTAATAASTTVAATEPPTTPAATTVPPTTVPPTTQPATTVPETTAPATTEPADPLAAVAAGALITIDDFAGGWNEQPPEPDTDDDEADAIIAECAGIDVALLSDDVLGTTRVDASFITTDEVFEVEHSVGFTADEATAAAAVAAISDPDIPGCYGEAVVQFFTEAQAGTDPADTLPPGIEIGEVTTEVGDLSGFALQSSEAQWFHVAYPLTLDGQTFEQHADFIFLRNGTALSQVLLTGFGAAFPVEDIQGIVELADARLAAIA